VPFQPYLPVIDAIDDQVIADLHEALGTPGANHFRAAAVANPPGNREVEDLCEKILAVLDEIEERKTPKGNPHEHTDDCHLRHPWCLAEMIREVIAG
jgi:hypothetical protein